MAEDTGLKERLRSAAVAPVPQMLLTPVVHRARVLRARRIASAFPARCGSCPFTPTAPRKKRSNAGVKTFPKAASASICRTN